MNCPKCGSDEITVVGIGPVALDLNTDGNGVTRCVAKRATAFPCDYERTNESTARCRHCSWEGCIGELQINQLLPLEA